MKNKFYICSIIKDEQLFLKEWLDYHLSIGFNKIFLYEDFTSTSHKEITDNYSQVELHSMSEIPDCEPNKVGRQIAVYNYFCNTHDDGWCLFIDLDEYLRLDNTTLDQLTKQFSDKVGLCIWWKCYGANGNINRPTCGVQEAYSNDYLENWSAFWQFKSFINLKEASKYDEEQQSHFVNCHYHKRIYNTNGNKADFRQGINRTYKSYQLVWIDHYISKSWEDYVQRLKRGNVTKGIRNVDSFFRMNPNMLSLKDELIKNLDYDEFPTI